jgi:hypothetical protein
MAAPSTVLGGLHDIEFLTVTNEAVENLISEL